MNGARSSGRARRRGVAIGAAAMALVAWFALAQPRPDPPRRTQPSGPRTVAYTMEGVTITFPFGWHLVPEAGLDAFRFEDHPGRGTLATRSILQLSNFDPGIEGTPICPGRNGSVPPRGVVLYVLEVTGFPKPIDAPLWPIGLDAFPSAPTGTDPCTGGTTVAWFAAGTVYQAHVSFGPQAAAADRRAAAAAFDSMRFDGDHLLGNLSPTVTIGHVRVDGGPRALLAYRGPTGLLCVEVDSARLSCDLALPSHDTVRLSQAYRVGDAQDVVVVGAVDGRAAAARVSYGDRRWVPARISRVPASLQFGSKIFSATLPTRLPGAVVTVQALDRHGRVIATTRGRVWGA